MTNKPTFITQYNRPSSTIFSSCVEFKEPSKVKTSLSYATDINTIYENYCKTGKLPLNGQQPVYDENFVKFDSLIEAQRIIGEASEYFNSMPTEVRQQYGNSLETFVRAIESKDDFLFDKGVLIKPEPVQNDPVVPSVVPDIPSVQPTVPVVTETVPVPSAITA
ncbi:internal scaffolding protein [Sigmofec virus UA08Rod_4769]|uniref:Internal scaffolding protein n=1 Tax=Sigmofec virus UA08Rod_4769 TaxID=2929408 RepID=A0A976R7G1_9VIRU|nr:internal scaffolding protein [Sigmofec virus UA08Rod_4769]